MNLKSSKLKILHVDGFTLVELLIVIGLLCVLAVGLLTLMNPLLQIQKAHDSTRKRDLENLQKAMDDYYNDHGCYPKASEVCVPPPVNICNGSGQTTRAVSQTCFICGDNSSSPSFAPYLSKLPCDPLSPSKQYMYQAEVPANSCTSAINGRCSSINCTNYCPTWYRIYTDFETVSASGGSDPESKAAGCYGGGCGLTPDEAPTLTPPYGYDYGVTNGNVLLQSTTYFFCVAGNECNGCGSTYETCYNSNNSCNKSAIYSSCYTCCQASGKCDPKKC